MMVKSLEKEKPHQEGSNLNYDAKVIKSSRKSLPIDLKYPERFSILTRPETARAINSCSSIFKFGKSTKLPEKGKELNTKGKEFFSPSRCKQLSLAESEDITILPKELSKFTDFNYSTPEEVSLYSSLNLMPSFKSPEKIESYRNFGIKITPKPENSIAIKSLIKLESSIIDDIKTPQKAISKTVICVKCARL